jgi:hypothetical protein
VDVRSSQPEWRLLGMATGDNGATPAKLLTTLSRCVREIAQLGRCMRIRTAPRMVNFGSRSP